MIKQPLYFMVYLVFTGMQLLFPSQATAQEPEISTQFIQINELRIDRSVYEYTFKVTLVNYDTAIKNVSATVTSSSPFTTIMDDDTVSFNDVATNETVESSDTFVLRQDRTQAFNPDDLQWTISYEPDILIVSADVKINLISMTEGGQFTVAQSKDLTTAIDFMSSEGDTPYTVEIAQTVSPATGLTVTPNLDGAEFTYAEDTIDKHNQLIKASIPGEYIVTTIATITETGSRSTHIAKYKVLLADAPNISIPWPTIHIEGFDMRHALKPDTLTQVTISMSAASGRDYDKVTGMKVIEPDKGLEIILNDKGEGADRTPNNGFYTSHIVELDSTGMESGECLYFHAIVSTSKGDVKSNTKEICISNLMFDKPYLNKAEDWVRDGSATAFSRTTLSVSFYKGTTDARIMEIVESVDATIVDSSLYFMDFVIKLNHPPSSAEAAAFIRQKSEELEAFPEVRIAGFTIGGGILSTYSDDPLYHSESDNGASQSRADEAWYVVQGKQPVAILDSGIPLCQNSCRP